MNAVEYYRMQKRTIDKKYDSKYQDTIFSIQSSYQKHQTQARRLCEDSEEENVNICLTL